MKHFHLITILAATALLATAQPALAGGWYLGGGLQTVSFDDDLEAIDTGSGPVFSGGYRFGDYRAPMAAAVDLLWGGSLHNESLSDSDVAHGDFLVGVKLSFGRDAFQPYLVGGLSGHAVDFDRFEEITGGGVYWGFGADVFVARRHAINLSFRSSNWDGEDSAFDYDVTTDITAIVYNFHFER